MPRKRKGAQVIAVYSPPRVKATMLAVQKALATWGAYCDAHYLEMTAPDCESHWANDPNLRHGVAVEQAGFGRFSRYQAAFEAWKRKAPWATEERLEADAKLFVDFVAREAKTIAPVISLAERRAAK